MMLRVVPTVAVAAALIISVACGGADNAAPATSSAPAAAPAPATAPKPSGSLSLLEPTDGAMGGHIDVFRWSPVEGADGYVIRIVAVTGNRVVWESDPMTVTETKLPPTVALEPEVHMWSVTARKGGSTLVTSATQRFTITP